MPRFGDRITGVLLRELEEDEEDPEPEDDEELPAERPCWR